MDKATQQVDALVRHVINSRGIVLDYIALTTLVDLVDLSAMMIVFLHCPGHREGHMGMVPVPNIGNLA
jgi:hypothetical protein